MLGFRAIMPLLEGTCNTENNFSGDCSMERTLKEILDLTTRLRR